MVERNSEGKQTWMVVGLAILAGLAAIGDQLLDAGLLSQWPTVVVIVTALVSAAVAVGAYTRSRPAKHLAMAEAARVEAAKGAGAASADPSKP